jgi:shikimate kinase
LVAAEGLDDFVFLKLIREAYSPETFQSTRFGEGTVSSKMFFFQTDEYLFPMNSNIVLIGFMGCGKSSIGRRLAKRMNYGFLDSDDLIIARAQGTSISQLFAEEGEERFRDRETAELRELVDAKNILLATGGGAILREENRELLHRIGRIVWLHADPEILFERASRNNKRPLLNVENPRRSFNALLESRIPIYEAISDIQIDATGLPHEQTIEAIIRALELNGDEKTGFEPSRE